MYTYPSLVHHLCYCDVNDILNTSSYFYTVRQGWNEAIPVDFYYYMDEFELYVYHLPEPELRAVKVLYDCVWSWWLLVLKDAGYVFDYSNLLDFCTSGLSDKIRSDTYYFILFNSLRFLLYNFPGFWYDEDGASLLDINKLVWFLHFLTYSSKKIPKWVDVQGLIYVLAGNIEVIPPRKNKHIQRYA